ncbi:hypothetical protein AGLY_010296 [Aphis glycines]|uniref:Uncharacterized protein n=1 Tax=Aphis glycines TaxID=307491 RepID=A0A6G0THT3_APHGL|nr:hypothetical protein AGLY_010296 [Aphis glycines]
MAKREKTNITTNHKKLFFKTITISTPLSSRLFLCDSFALLQSKPLCLAIETNENLEPCIMLYSLLASLSFILCSTVANTSFKGSSKTKSRWSTLFRSKPGFFDPGISRTTTASGNENGVDGFGHLLEKREHRNKYKVALKRLTREVRWGWKTTRQKCFREEGHLTGRVRRKENRTHRTPKRRWPGRSW